MQIIHNSHQSQQINSSSQQEKHWSHWELFVSCCGGIFLLGNCESPVYHKQFITALAVINHSRICSNLYKHLSVPMPWLSLLSKIKVIDVSYNINMYISTDILFMVYPLFLYYSTSCFRSSVMSRHAADLLSSKSHPLLVRISTSR